MANAYAQQYQEPHGPSSAHAEDSSPPFHNPVQDWEASRRFKTRSGIRVRSKIEKIIADFFFDQGIAFFYEPPLDLDGVFVCPDFYLPAYDLIYEHFGRSDEHYRRLAESKLARYRECGVEFIYTVAGDEPDIEEVLTDLLAEQELKSGRR